MNIEQAQALALICHYAKEYLKDNKTMSQSVDIAQDIIKKELKALEIIKEKSVNVRGLFLSKNSATYNSSWNLKKYPERNITQEEYDLLKEILL